MLIRSISAEAWEGGESCGDPLYLLETDAGVNHQTCLIAVLTDPEKGRQRI